MGGHHEDERPRPRQESIFQFQMPFVSPQPADLPAKKDRMTPTISDRLYQRARRQGVGNKEQIKAHLRVIKRDERGLDSHRSGPARLQMIQDRDSCLRSPRFQIVEGCFEKT
jgi:hypothetical protein